VSSIGWWGLRLAGGDFIWIDVPGLEPIEYSTDAGAEVSPISPTGLQFAITGTPYTPPAATPEPSTIALLGTSLLGFAVFLCFSTFRLANSIIVGRRKMELDA
jgi:hypothetical protein